MANTQTTREQYDQYLRELDECVAGRRGYVICNKKRAEKMGLQFGSLKVAAECKGLVVETHGNQGYIAYKK